MNKQIEANRKEAKSFYLPSSGETCFKSLDGSDCAAWLRRNGYVVSKNMDAGRNGYAITECGVYVSTNGYVSYR